uniref:TSA: Wollemia nobilis Ref_Wollemi_Transcript_6294_1911 transcribed RNA sequence n=1 Tax=Wollemia nobilis TaxID=56998 RepID=A0A0C9RXC2_9CONI
MTGLEVTSSSTSSSWWLYAAIRVLTKGPSLAGESVFACVELSLWPLCMAALVAVLVSVFWVVWSRPGGVAWKGKTRKDEQRIPGPRGWPVVGSLMHMTWGLAHRNLAELAASHGATKLMAFSLGWTPAVITSDSDVAREILNSPYFADRPLKQSAKQLMFERAMGFAPSGDYWRMLRRISATHLFAPRRIAAHERGRQADLSKMLQRIRQDCAVNGVVKLRPHLQAAALNNIMGSVFGRRLDVESEESEEVRELRSMVEEGFQLLGEFNWADHLPWLRLLDPLRIHHRCARLVPRVKKFVTSIIEEHRRKNASETNPSLDGDFVDVLLSLQEEDKLEDDDMVAVLWEMIFRGTDTTALLAEWTMGEMVLNPEVQSRVQAELDAAVGRQKTVRDEDMSKLPYLQAVVKETLRRHPPGPLLSWARMATRDVHIADRWRVPKGTTAMVNMWAIAHDSTVWRSPRQFMPDRFLDQNVDVRGSDLRLAPFGAGRRVCPGKALGLATVHLWVAALLHNFDWLPAPHDPVDLSEVLKLSCQMAKPLTAIPVSRNNTRY